MSLPMCATLIAVFSLSVVDTYFVSLLGDTQLTAMGFILAINEAVIGIGIGVGVGVINVISRYIGENNLRGAKETLVVAIGLSIVVGLALMLVGYLTHDFIFKTLLGATQIVQIQIWQYIKIWLIGVPLILLLFVAAFSNRAYGENYISSSVMISWSLLNLALDPLLIFGLWGFPELGISGAAAATVIASFIVFLSYLGYAFYKKLLAIPKSHQVRIHLRELLAITIPASLADMIPPISIAITTALLASISLNAVAAYAVVARVQMFSLIPLLVISGSISPIIAQNFGAGDTNRINQTLRNSLICCVVWGLFVAIALFIFKTPIVNIFTDHQQMINVAESYFIIVPLSFIGWGMIMMYSSYYNATKRALISLSISILRMLVVYIPLAFLLKYFYGYHGIFLAFAITNFAVAFGVMLFQKSKRSRIQSR